jgi:protein N-lysine methyltransferase METTL21D
VQHPNKHQIGMSAQPAPAHLTKHIPVLEYSINSSVFLLSQLSDGVSNGTALWLGGQCLAMYLAQMHNKFKPSNLQRPPRAIELGSGIGLTTYVHVLHASAT